MQFSLLDNDVQSVMLIEELKVIHFQRIVCVQLASTKLADQLRTLEYLTATCTYLQ